MRILLSTFALGALAAMAIPSFATRAVPYLISASDPAFPELKIVAGKKSISMQADLYRGTRETFCFRGDFASVTRQAEKDLLGAGWIRRKPDLSRDQASFIKGGCRVNILRARTEVQRCPVTSKVWHKTSWPAAKAKAGIVDRARGWVTIECVLGNPLPAPTMAKPIATTSRPA